MKIRIDDYCIRCGVCIDLYPDLFKRNWEDHCIDLVYEEAEGEIAERYIKAAKDCAVTAIKLRCEKCTSGVAENKSEDVRINPMECEGCAVCAIACPKSCITIVNEQAFVNATNCVKCGVCAKECPTHAIMMKE